MPFGRNADKRGSSSGGSSTGRDGQKRGGRTGSADPNTVQDRGARTCGTCAGSGQVATPRVEVETQDGNEQFAGEDYAPCKSCKGTGTR